MKSPLPTNTKKLCEAKEGCNKEIAFTLIDHKRKTKVNCCNDHFTQGMRAWLEPDPIIKALMQKGIL